jgi:hypothetical protein
MCFNKFLGLVICIQCEAAIGSKTVAKHLHDIHKDANIRIEHPKLNQVITDLEVKESFDLSNLPPTCLQIEGLRLSSEAYLCSNCQLIRGTLKSIQEHHLAAHGDCPIPVSWTRVAAQQIHHQQRTPYFQVIPKSVPLENDDAVTWFFTSLNKDRQKAVADFDISKIDPRQVSTWLKATQWHVLVAPYDHQHLVSLVVMPTKAEPQLEILAKAVHTYTCKADQAMDTLSNLALRIINSPEPP